MSDNGIAEGRIEEWLEGLPTSLVDRVSHVDAEAEHRNYKVTSGGLSVNVIQTRPRDPIKVGTNVTFGEQLLAAIHDQRDRFVAEISSVLTNSSGIHVFTENGNKPDDEADFDGITLRYWIYPDGATQHELNNAVMDQLMQAQYIRDTAKRIAREPDILR